MKTVTIKEKIDIRFSTENGKVQPNSDRGGQFEAEFVFRAVSKGAVNTLNLNEKYPLLYLRDLHGREYYRLYDAIIEEFDKNDIKIVGTSRVKSLGSKQPQGYGKTE